LPTFPPGLLNDFLVTKKKEKEKEKQIEGLTKKNLQRFLET
jgi:hypothetical protein